uniref:DNA-directed RNA polymerase n=1 Tax=Rhizophora mucronata TaxID=61149 RepID=A0A2P2MP51_RHIMU
MLSGHHVTAFPLPLSTGLLNVSSTSVTQTSLMVVLLQIQVFLDKDQSLGESNVDALGMHGLESQDYEGNKIPAHLSVSEPPVSK